MKKLSLFILATCITTVSYANVPSQTVDHSAPNNMLSSVGQISIKMRPEILGLWGMEIKKPKKCIEYYNFKANNEVVVKSGNEWSTGVYDYQRSPELNPNLSALTMQIQHDNNEIDCSGVQVDQTGEVSQYYVKWNDAKTLSLCNNNNANQCFATLKRVLP